mmetsp:Transcript_302/g.686  ORF Transcript_302/g.686 Transcript_302/m.686 type:complete len:1370 (-) Transcript_302:267-4376(-)
MSMKKARRMSFMPSPSCTKYERLDESAGASQSRMLMRRLSPPASALAGKPDPMRLRPADRLQRIKQHDKAIILQRWYRKHVYMYKKFGPVIFARKNGGIADFGAISFLSGMRAANFLTISNTASTAMLSHFLEKYWALPRPDVLISVTGSAMSLQLTSQLQRVFDRGLVAAASVTKAWIFTGGTDSGVMKLVGEAMHKYGLDVPVVGVAPWGAIQGRHMLENCKGETINYRDATRDSAKSGEGAKLNPYHTHQILVDTARVYTKSTPVFGQEQALRARLEREYMHRGVPVVLLVVQGGPGTVDMMRSAAKEGYPILVLADSGGAATAVYTYFEEGIEAVEEPFVASHSKFEELKKLHVVHGSNLVSFFKLGEDESNEDMSSALLRAIFGNLMHNQTILEINKKQGGGAAAKSGAQKEHDQMQRALLLTVKWDRPDFARKIMSSLPQSQDHDTSLNKMLQSALELQRVDIVKLLIERPGQDVSGVNLSHLYMLEDKFNFLRKDQALQRRMQRSIHEIFHTKGTDDERASYKVFSKLVGPFLRSNFASFMYGVVESNNRASHHDIFFWSVIMGNSSLARELWGYVEHPLHCALLASHQCKEMANNISWGQEETRKSAAEFESWAVGAMECVQEQEQAHFILSKPILEWKMGAAVDIALTLDHKGFLSHRHCQSLLDQWWRGGYANSICTLSGDTSAARVLLWTIFPFLNPHLKETKTAKKRGTPIGWKVYEELIFSSLAQALQLSTYEREQAVASDPGMNGTSKADRSFRKTPLNMPKSLLRNRRSSRSLLDSVDESEEDEDDLLDDDEIEDYETLKKLAEQDAKDGFVPEEKSTDESMKSASSAATKKPARKTSDPKPRVSIFDRKQNPEPEVEEQEPPLGFYSIPMVKYLLRVVHHVLYLLMYSMVLTGLRTPNQLQQMAPNLPPLDWPEMIFGVWSFAVAIDHVHRTIRMRSLVFTRGDRSMPFASVVNAGHAIVVITIIFRLFTTIPWLPYSLVEPAYSTYSTLLSIDAVLLCGESFTFLWTSLRFGVRTVILTEMMLDLYLYLVFFAVFVIGFALCLIGLCESAPLNYSAFSFMVDPPFPEDLRALSIYATDGDQERARTLHHGGMRQLAERQQVYNLPLVLMPFWAMFADLDLEQLSEIPWAMTVTWFYVLVTNIVLVNLLIAMFSDTYSRIIKEALTEYHFQRYLHVFEFQHVIHSIPPPFNLPLLLIDIFDAVRDNWSTTGFVHSAFIRPLPSDMVPGQSSSSVSGSTLARKYVQRFLKSQAEEELLTSTAQVKRVQAQLSTLEAQVSSKLEKVITMMSADRTQSPGKSRISCVAKPADAPSEATPPPSVVWPAGNDSLREISTNPVPPESSSARRRRDRFRC